MDIGSPSAAASTVQQLGEGVLAVRELGDGGRAGLSVRELCDRCGGVVVVLCDGGRNVLAVLAGHRALFNVIARRQRRRQRRQRRRFLRLETYDARSRTRNGPLNCLTWDKTRRDCGPPLRLGL